MILLDGLDKNDENPSPKLVAEALVPVVRVQTPTPSLPPYEASQAQLGLPTVSRESQLRSTVRSYHDIQTKRTRKRRCRKYTIYILAAYFILTVVVGVPVLVVKLKRKVSMKSSPYQSWDETGPIPPKTVTLGDAPLRLSSAKSCNTWNVKDRPYGNSFVSQLEYTVPMNGTVFLNTNVTYATNASYLNQFSGSLLVAVNDNATVTDGLVHVTMHHTTPQLRNLTNVCLMGTGSGGGVYLFAPQSMNIGDALTFNITLLLPRNHTSPRYISQLMCNLPHFAHTYRQLDPQISIGSAIFGGAMSSVYVESMQAATAVVRASSAEIRGTFRVASKLSLETSSAPINADIHLYNDGAAHSPTYMHLATGNSPLNANVSLYVSSLNPIQPESDAEYTHGPNFRAHAETFNAPLNVSVLQEDDTAPPIVHLRAINNLGQTHVTLDSKYSGTFDVNTMFAEADVLTWDGADFNTHYNDDDYNDDDGDAYASTDVHKDSKIWVYLPTLGTTSTGSEPTDTTAEGRCLQYDVISSSQICGWVGPAPRPPHSSSTGQGSRNISHVEVISSLNSAQLILQP